MKIIYFSYEKKIYRKSFGIFKRMPEDNIFMKQEKNIKKDRKEYGWENDKLQWNTKCRNMVNIHIGEVKEWN